MTLTHCAAVWLLVCYLSTVASQNSTITVNCNGTTDANHTEVYGGLLELKPATDVSVTCAHLRPETQFIIFQTHAYRYNVTLYQGEIKRNSSFVGTNVGMYEGHNLMTPEHTFSIANFNNVSVRVYVSVHAYHYTDPIPGGCNLVNPVEVDPTLEIRYKNDLIKVVAAPGKIFDSIECGGERNSSDLYIVHTFYRLYLAERTFTEIEYFNGIQKMLSLGSIMEHGSQVPTSSMTVDLIKLFSLYPGTGSVHVAVAMTPYGQSVYVPTVTYGCSLSDGEDTCNVFSDVLSQVTCAMMFFTGLFVCYAGHRFFKTEMFLAGLLAGAIVTYVGISHTTNLHPTATLGAALLSGLLSGAIWLLFWWFYGVPLVAVMLPTLLLGFVTASLLMFLLPDGNEILAVDVNYWSIFWIIMTFVPVALVFVTLHANLLSCAVLGAYATVFPVDHYIGSNLKYIVINTVRRASDPDFYKANLSAPYQWRDALMTAAWVALAVSGYLLQRRRCRGRAPFPPPPRDTLPALAPPLPASRFYTREEPSAPRPRYFAGRARRPDNERTPLLE